MIRAVLPVRSHDHPAIEQLVVPNLGRRLRRRQRPQIGVVTTHVVALIEVHELTTIGERNRGLLHPLLRFVGAQKRVR
jgi:hypothetical protein